MDLVHISSKNLVTVSKVKIYINKNDKTFLIYLQQMYSFFTHHVFFEHTEYAEILIEQHFSK